MAITSYIREACYTSLKDRSFWRDLHTEVLENYVVGSLWQYPIRLDSH